MRPLSNQKGGVLLLSEAKRPRKHLGQGQVVSLINGRDGEETVIPGIPGLVLGPVFLVREDQDCGPRLLLHPVDQPFASLDLVGLGCG